jgi:hypothetical protein
MEFHTDGVGLFSGAQDSLKVSYQNVAQEYYNLQYCFEMAT